MMNKRIVQTGFIVSLILFLIAQANYYIFENKDAISLLFAFFSILFFIYWVYFASYPKTESAQIDV